jgi:hypothetical protein
VLAGKSEELVALGALGNLDTVLVSPLLDLAIRPRVEKGIAERLLGSGGRGRSLSVGTLEVQAGKTGLATNAGNEAITSRRLGNRVAALVEPGLQVRVRPGLVEPVTRVVGAFGDLVRGRLVVLTDRLEKSITLAGLGHGNAMLVSERLELRVGPAMEC